MSEYKFEELEEFQKEFWDSKWSRMDLFLAEKVRKQQEVINQLTQENRKGLRPVSYEQYGQKFDGYLHAIGQNGNVNDDISMVAIIELEDGQTQEVPAYGLQFKDVNIVQSSEEDEFETLVTEAYCNLRAIVFKINHKNEYSSGSMGKIETTINGQTFKVAVKNSEESELIFDLSNSLNMIYSKKRENLLNLSELEDVNNRFETILKTLETGGN